MTHPFTPTYISMAKAAEEIQAKPFFEVGDWYLEGDKFQVVPQSTGLQFVGPPRKPEWVYIPRLDQLLGMVGDAHDFARFLRGLPYEEVNVEETGECRDWHELALAAVMREKHGKVWTGTEWRKA
jgi:hypothetical protein